MVIGRSQTARKVQEICFFCALRADAAPSRTTRRIHSSSRRWSQSVAAPSSQESGSTNLLEAQYSSPKNDQDVTSGQQDSKDVLYGTRYTSREPASWKKKPLILQQQASAARSSQRLQSSTLDPSRDRGQGHTRQDQKVALSLRSKDQATAVDGSKLRITRSSSVFQTSWRSARTDPEDKNTADQHSSDPSSIQGGGLFKKIYGKKRKLLRPKDEFNNGWHQQDELATTGKIHHHGLGAEETQEGSTLVRKARSAEDAPVWSNLPRRSEAPPDGDSPKKNDNGVARFQPLGRGGRKVVVRDSVSDSDTLDRTQRLASDSATRVNDKNQYQTSSTGYVGFRDSKPVIQESTESRPVQESAGYRRSLRSDVPASQPDVPERFREGRRAALWEGEDRKEKKSSKVKQSKTTRNQMDDKDDEIDPEKLERIEAKQRRKAQQKVAREDRASGQVFVVPSFISIGNLASSLKIRAEAFSEVLRAQGFSELHNDHVIDAETAGLIASELGFKAVLPAKVSEIDLVAQPPPTDTDLLPPRPPIVTIMGHVDHGKTTLLDWLRNSSIAASEHGGITQHIGAFTVQMPSGRIITFLDTPGHAAFLEMRARGANVTDIVILVVAADDSVKPQTIEAIKHAKAARTQVVVAISKIDKPEADAERVKQDLARYGIEVEDYGGDTQAVCVSGKTGQGMDRLEDAVIALADVLDVKADTAGNVEGWVLEAARKASGKIATLLVRRGTLKPGQIIVAGKTWARIRNLRNEAGAIIDEALPGTPVEVDGWDQQPEAGAEVLQAPNEQRARRVVDYRIGRAQVEKQTLDVAKVNEARKAHDEKRAREKAREVALARGEEVPEEEEAPAAPGFTEVPLIIRADLSGSIEAVNASVLALGNSEVRAKVIRTAVGNVAESDIEHAAAARGHIVNFNLPVDGEIARLAEKSGVKIIDGNIIYRITDDVKVVLEDQLPPLITSHVTGEAEILQVFDINLKGKKTLPVAGCKIRNGTITKGSKVKVIRGDKVLYDGVLSTLKNVKKDVTEMRKGMECGMSFDDFQAFDAGDQVQCYELKSERKRL